MRIVTELFSPAKDAVASGEMWMRAAPEDIAAAAL
jgi:hypothetical protein